jgi:hypothetical protein
MDRWSTNDWTTNHSGRSGASTQGRPRAARARSTPRLGGPGVTARLSRAVACLRGHVLVAGHGAHGEGPTGPLDALARSETLDVASLERCLGEAAGVRFEPMAPRPKRRRGGRAPLEPGQAEGGLGPGSYDRAITQDGVVPTREGNLHDLLNAVAWAWFPRAKRRLHALQHDAIGRRLASGARGRRTREEDALALLDEGGVLLAVRAEARTATARALLLRDEATLGRLARQGALVPWLFGHALLEHLARGDEAVRGTALVTDVEPEQPCRASLVAALDGWLAERLEAPLGDPRELPSASLATLAGRAEP